MNFCNARFNLIALLLSLSLSVHAGKCWLADAMSDKALAHNAKFWNEYSQLAARGTPSQEAILALARKHNPSFGGKPAAITAPVRTSRIELNHHKRAHADIQKLQPALKRRYDVFLETIQGPDGLQAFYKNPGSWHMERLPQFGKNAHSVRLNGDVRVLFDVENGKVLVREVNRDKIHGS